MIENQYENLNNEEFWKEQNKQDLFIPYSVRKCNPEYYTQKVMENPNEGSIDIADINPKQIRVKSKKTGVCRSDIDMMNGNFGPIFEYARS